MANRFNVKLPVTEDPKEKEVAAVFVKEMAEKDFEAQVVGATLPVVLDFYAAGSKPCEALAPRFAAVAEKFAGKVNFLKVLRQDGAGLSGKLGVTGNPTLVFFKGGKETGERLSGEDIKRTALKAQVEALLA
ncbi:MAG TPA: thioredoxin family protein [Anaeromyxobacteraceae bacterium]